MIKIKSLGQVLPWIEKNNNNVMVFVDWDQTIVKNNTNIPLDIADAKKFFSFLEKHNVPWRILTGRFSNYVCNSNQEDLKFGLNIMATSIEKYMYSALDTIGARKDFNTDPSTYVELTLEGKCVGISYMGILFGTQKGAIIKSFMETFGNDSRLKNKIPILIDDNLDFLHNAQKYNIQTFQKL